MTRQDFISEIIPKLASFEAKYGIKTVRSELRILVPEDDRREFLSELTLLDPYFSIKGSREVYFRGIKILFTIPSMDQTDKVLLVHVIDF